MSNTKTIKQTMYNVMDVKKGYNYWYRYLLGKCITMFTYEGLPNSLPYNEVEKRILEKGYNVFFKHPKYGVVTSNGGASGFDMYYRPTRYVYTQPILGSGTKKIGVDAVIVYNSAMDTRFQQGIKAMLQRYARELADVDSTYNNILIQSRAMSTNIAKSKSAIDSLKRYYERLTLGDIAVVENAVDGMSLFDDMTINPNQKDYGQLLPIVKKVKKETLYSFFNELGIIAKDVKKERMTSEEVASETQILVINTQDMLQQRIEGVQRLNEMFGLNISVRLNPLYNPLEYIEEDIENDVI